MIGSRKSKCSFGVLLARWTASDVRSYSLRAIDLAGTVLASAAFSGVKTQISKAITVTTSTGFSARKASSPEFASLRRNARPHRTDAPRRVASTGASRPSAQVSRGSELTRPSSDFCINRVSFKRYHLHRLRHTPPVVRSFFTSSARLFFAPAESQYESGFTAELGEADSVGELRRSQARFQ